MESEINKIEGGGDYIEKCLENINNSTTFLIYKKIIRYTERDVSQKAPCGISQSDFHFRIRRIKRRDRPDFSITISYPQTSRADVIPRRLRKISSLSKQTYRSGDMSIYTYHNAASLKLLILAINLVSHRLYQITTRQSLSNRDS